MEVIFSRGETLKGEGVKSEFKTVDSNYFILFSHFSFSFYFIFGDLG